MLNSMGTKDKTKEAALIKFELLVKSADLYEIRCASNYILSNVSDRTSKKSLSEFKEQLSGLLKGVESHKEYLIFDKAYKKLWDALPETIQDKPVVAILPCYRIGITNTSLEDTTSDSSSYEAFADIDETTPLLNQTNIVKNHNRLFGKIGK